MADSHTLNILTDISSWPYVLFTFSDCNGTRTHNHLVRKRTLKNLVNLAKWLSCVVSTYLYGAFYCMLLLFHVRVFSLSSESTLYSWIALLSLKLQISWLFRARKSLTFRQLWSENSLWNACVIWLEHTVTFSALIIFPISLATNSREERVSFGVSSNEGNVLSLATGTHGNESDSFLL